MNIHFTRGHAQDLDMIQAAGFKFIRMDFQWSSIETERGVYDFGAYDELTDELDKRGIRALYILDYGNPLYQCDQSVRTEEGRQAFARFAAAAAAHYRGRGIIWELWNEPNLKQFWRTEPAVDEYMALAKVVLPAVRQADPDALRVAPATSRFPRDFLESCFRQGLLELVDAVSVHPYTRRWPESAATEVLWLRALIARYRPDRPDLPVISGEWGYSSVWTDFDDQRQGQFLPRELLANLSLGIPLSVWYDWHDDGTDPKEAEHHFGVVTYDYQPKPAHAAMLRLVGALRGMSFAKRLESAPRDYLLLFSDGERRMLAAWTISEPHEVEPIAGQRISLTGAPQYLAVPATATAITAEGAWTVRTRAVGVRGGPGAGEGPPPEIEVHVVNPFAEPVKVRVMTRRTSGLVGRFASRPAFELAPGEQRSLRWRGRMTLRDAPGPALTVTVDMAGMRSRQTAPFVITNPIVLTAACQTDGGLAAVVSNPTGEAFRGTLEAQVGAAVARYALRLYPDAAKAQADPLFPSDTPGAAAAVAPNGNLTIPLPFKPRSPDTAISLVLREDDNVVAQWQMRVVPLTVSSAALRAVEDGDASIPVKFELADAALDEPWAPGSSGLRLSYDFAEGWKLIRLVPAQGLAVDGQPHQIGVWVKGDGSRCALRAWFVDRAGRTFQPEFGALDFKGWRYLTARLDDPTVYSVGPGGDPNRIAYPITVSTPVLLASPHPAVAGELRFGGLHLIYREPGGSAARAPELRS